MPSDTASAALRDIAHHSDLAVHFTTGFDYEAFVADPRTVYAVTRCVRIISEASRRLPDDFEGAASLDCMEGYGRNGQHLSPRL
jgi:uncharacterized protein with HEPN domain